MLWLAVFFTAWVTNLYTKVTVLEMEPMVVEDSILSYKDLIHMCLILSAYVVHVHSRKV